VERNATNEGLFTYGKEVEIIYNNDTKLRGKLQTPKYSRAFIDCTGFEKAVFLSKKYFYKDQGQDDVYIVEYSNVPADDIIDDVVAGEGIAATEVPEDEISVRFEYSDKLSCIKTVAVALNKDWWFSYSGTLIFLYIKDKGSSKGTVTSTSTVKRTVDYDSIENKIHAKAVDQYGNVFVSVAEDATSQSQYGVSESFYEVKDVLSQSTLDSIANAILLSKKDPVERISTEIPLSEWDSKNLESGDMVTLDTPEATGTWKIQKLTASLTTVKLELGNPQVRVQELLSDYLKSFEIRKKTRKTTVSYATYGFRKGTTFPSKPYLGETFHRTDLDTTFRWNGEEWIPIDRVSEKANLIENGDFEQWSSTEKPRVFEIVRSENVVVSQSEDCITGGKSIKFEVS